MAASKLLTSPKTHWETQKAKLKIKFNKLTDEDLNSGENKKPEFLNHMGFKLALKLRN